MIGSVDELPRKMSTLNKTKIKSAYSVLLSTVKKKLKSVELDTREFYDHIVHIFEPEEISRLLPDFKEAKDIDRTFEVLTKAHCWGFGDVSQLKSIVSRFIEEDEHLISDYKVKLTSYKATTKIIEWMKSEEMKEESEEDDCESVTLDAKKYNLKFRKKLSAKLFKGEGAKAKLSTKSLDYIEKFWEELCEEFDMMSLSCVLDSITDGCIEITWHIPSRSASQILAHINSAVHFFERKFVSNIILEDVVIYSGSFGVATQKVR